MKLRKDKFYTALCSECGGPRFARCVKDPVDGRLKLDTNYAHDCQPKGEHADE